MHFGTVDNLWISNGKTLWLMPGHRIQMFRSMGIGFLGFGRSVEERTTVCRVTVCYICLVEQWRTDRYKVCSHFQHINQSQNFVKVWLRRGSSPYPKKSALTEKLQWGITHKPNALPTRLCRRLVKEDVLVVCIRACSALPPFPIHCSIGGQNIPRSTMVCRDTLLHWASITQNPNATLNGKSEIR